MNFNKKLAVAVSGAVLLMAGQFALADSTTDIVDALVSKGVLTEEEGKLITKGHKSKTDITPVVKTKDNALSLETADGKSSIQVNGRVHFDYRTFDYPANNTSATAAAAGSDTFDMRRARIGVKGKFGNYYSGEIVINTVGNTGSTTADILDVAYLDVAWFEKAKLRFGQFKMPFSLEQLTSSNNIDFIERSFVDGNIPAKERGAQVFGEPMDGMTYALAVSTGLKAAENSTTGSRELDNAHSDVDFIGRATINFAEIVKNKDMVAHLGLAFQSGDQYKSVDAMGAAQKPRSRSDVTIFTPGAGTLSNVFSNQVDRQRIGLEGALASGPFKIQGQYVDSKFDFQTAVGVDQRPSIEAGYIQALYTLTGETHASRYKAGVFGSFKPAKNFDPETMTGGAWEIGARYGFFDASDYRGISGATTNGFFKANDMTLGVKFVANPNFRVMADYMKTTFKDQIGTGVTLGGHANLSDEKAILVRTQLMF
ncbi:OprO/OprP family phosphate-selective porin [Candidatus Methylopumilus planktonicus]|uniref:OprO/OprP family phosphate-selective porin n=1 Tax=Candidatus Methylopumilus planktonicus TaxID=1581557 RepID=UPI003D18D203